MGHDTCPSLYCIATNFLALFPLITMYEPEGPARVAAGIITEKNKVLICQRGINHRYGLKWEFPGGKIYPGETLAECLIRELEEELSIIPTSFEELRTLQITYSDGRTFHITFFLVKEYQGTVTNNVFENIAWVTKEQLATYDLLEGSLPVIPYL